MIINRKIIQHPEEIHEAFQIVKSQNKGFRTNFFFEPFKHGLWIEKGELELIRINMSVILLHTKEDFKTLFFIVSGLSDLEETLNIFLSDNKNEKLVLDLVGTDINSNEFILFSKAGFLRISTLVRMSSFGHSGDLLTENAVGFAAISEIPVIDSLLQKYFDKYVDQLPMNEELINWVDKKQLLVYRVKDRIGGFLIFEGTVSTAYLRYWFVHPDFREQKIGSKLIMQFFELNKNAKRYLFWVKEDNENAIKRYAHYGFKNENLKDLVLTYNII